MGRIVGIDLGTTYSVVAALEPGGTKILQNKEAQPQTRSVVGYYKGNFLIGSPALNRWPLAAKDTIVSIKRLMGRAYSDPEVKKMKEWADYEIVEPSEGTKDSVCVKLGGKEYFPAEISAMILRKLKEDAEYVLKDEVTHAVITVPAYFSDKQIQATRQAGLDAGLSVMKIIDEPTAAAVAFGMDTKEKEARIVLVYDLGGGTFDVSVLMMSAGTFAVLNKEGDMWLGGDNFDNLIVDYIVDQIKKEHGIDPTKNLRFMVSLKIEAQKAKEALSSSHLAQIMVLGILHKDGGKIIDVDTEIKSDDFEKMIQPLIDRTVSLVEKGVKNANYELDEIDYVLMAGNSSCIPKVQAAMENLFGKEKVLRKVHPKNCVAIGAAITGVYLGQIECPKCKNLNPITAKTCEECGHQPLLTEEKICLNCGRKNKIDAEKCQYCKEEVPDIDGLEGGYAPFHYGIQTAEEDNLDKMNVFIEKNDKYQTPEEKREWQTKRTQLLNQRILSIPVYGGDDREVASKNTKMGEALAILPANLPQGTPIKIKLWLNKHGHFELAAQLEDGRDLKARVLRGDLYQQVVEMLMECMGEERNIVSMLSQKEKEKASKFEDDIIRNLENDKIEDAKQLAEEYDAFLKKPRKQPKQSLTEQAEGIVNHTTHIVNEYDWAIGSSAAFALNNIKGELQEAIQKDDSDLMEGKINELLIELDKFMKKTLGGVFMALHWAIIIMVQPADLALAQNLRQELKGIEWAFRNKQPDAEVKLSAFAKKLEKVIEEIGPPVEGIRCPKCKHLNKKLRKGRYCEKCDYDFWIPTGHRSTGA